MNTIWLEHSDEQDVYVWDRRFKAIFYEDSQVVVKDFQLHLIASQDEEEWQRAILEMSTEDIRSLKVNESYPFLYKESPLSYGFVVRVM